ncbi:MAG: exo-alpha-sialidase [Rhodothermales bacterium]
MSNRVQFSLFFCNYNCLRSSLYLLIVCLSACTSPEIQEKPVGPEYIFQAGAEGYACFRIPAIVSTLEGSLLAFAEGRKRGCSDTGDIDLVMKRSEDNGITWSALSVIWDDGENTSGNPAPVVDKTTGTILLLSTWNLGSDREPQIISLESEDTRRVFVLSSSDNGETWTVPEEITENVKLPEWTWYATGPGSGIQLTKGPHAGRLMIACDHIEAVTDHYYSHVIYSDDHGKTWQLGGSTPQHFVNESEVAELEDGSLLLNMRNYAQDERHRKISHSYDGGDTWSDLQSDTTLIEPICQASLQRYQFSDEGQSILLFSNPASKTKREHMTLRASFDDGKTWPKKLLIHAGMAAYSDLVRLPGNYIGIFYEAGPDQDHGYQGIAFERIALSELAE